MKMNYKFQNIPNIPATMFVKLIHNLIQINISLLFVINTDNKYIIYLHGYIFEGLERH